MKADKDCEALVKHFENCVLIPYKDIAGIWTVGIGRQIDAVTATKLSKGIDQKTADDWFTQDLQRFASNVTKLVKVALTQGQFNALVSFDYNTGALANSTLLKLTNSMQYTKAALEFIKWDHFVDPKTHTLEVSKGLFRRRLCERYLFQGGTLKDLADKQNWFMAVVS